MLSCRHSVITAHKNWSRCAEFMAAEELSSFLISFLFVNSVLSAWFAMKLNTKSLKWFGILSVFLLAGTVIFFAAHSSPILLTDLIANGLNEHPMPTRLVLLCGSAAAIPWCGAVALLIHLSSAWIRTAVLFTVSTAVTVFTFGLFQIRWCSRKFARFSELAEGYIRRVVELKNLRGNWPASADEQQLQGKQRTL